ncbi:MAG TPA: outer membrane beta-barrel protein [Myxococcus sp.]|nr:outer membrane beta-barrel protein [Myxococcus sp.]
MLRRLLPLLALLLAAPAAAQEDDDAVPTSLDGVGRISVQGGWRVTSNETLYNRWYGGKASGVPRARDGSGAPVGALTFAYAMSDLVELGIDLFGTAGRLYLNEPGEGDAPPTERRIDTVGYGALVGLRFQTVLPEVGPYGLVPFAGILTGPVLVSSQRQGESVQEATSQAWMGSLGATLRLSARWALTAEYRLAFMRGPIGPPNDRVGSFSGGGHWLTLGVTYTFPPEPSRPLPGRGY